MNYTKGPWQIDIAETLYAEFKQRGFEGSITIPENDNEDGEEYFNNTFKN